VYRFLHPFRQTSPLRGLNVYRPVSDQGLYAPGHRREETGPFVRFSVAIGTVFIIKAGKKISVPLKGTIIMMMYLKGESVKNQKIPDEKMNS